TNDGNGNSNVTAVPLPPIDLVGNAVSATQINLSWTDKSTNEDGFKIQRKTGTGIFTDIGNVAKDVTNYTDIGLSNGTTYMYRVYSYNNVGNSPTYSNEVSVKAILTITDTSGNTYPTVTIGTQVWMAENLRTTKYRDGSNIPIVTDITQWENNWNYGNPLQQPMMCWNNNDQATYTANKFGALYNWYAINPSTNGNKNVCPTGWHVPTDAEWTTLTTFLGGENVAGGKMKSTGTQYWQNPNQDATNSSGWSGLPGGFRNYDGLFYVVGSFGVWWSSTEYATFEALSRDVYYDNGDVGRKIDNKTFGFSVRCLRD
ncbi:MAG: FISUMP domain-containing protein, partial [Bacteroidota bacterium]